ncbi:zinc finger BED domain-containing protein 5-like [Octopus sinensis]|uniref:Zinc finger BED domain-containing protein 5-like n=1 Tax=Octopus sinensis TaxID=2607531 RepID=A0A6P7S9C5_9MOLL|nr:zinc finger BED domain-containing protein 5-like [Octopus sinensis]
MKQRKEWLNPDKLATPRAKLELYIRKTMFWDCQLPMCLLCHQALTNEAMKPSRLKYRFDAKHTDNKDKLLLYFLQLSSSFRKQTQTFKTLLQETSKQENDGLIASYNIALLVAKSGKSHTIGETLLRPVIEEVLSTSHLVIALFLDASMKQPSMSNISSLIFSRVLNFLYNWMSQLLWTINI